MAQRPKLNGRWRIIDAEIWDQEALDLVQPAFIEFRSERNGELGFIAVKGWLDCRFSTTDGHPSVEFSWEGKDEYDNVSGRGSAVLHDDGALRGRIFFHLGDDSSFLARRFDQGNRS